MGIEAIKNVSMSYQGSSKVAEVSSAPTAKVASSDIQVASSEIAHNTMAMNTKQTDNESGGNGNAGYSKQQEPTPAQIKKAVEEINKKANSSEAIFGVHEKTNRITIKIVDKETKEIIKEFPPEKTLDMIAKVWEVAGLMVDEKR